MSNIRKIIRAKRRSLSKAQLYKSSIKILHNLLKHDILKYQKIAIYTPFDGEVPTSKIIKFLQKQGKQVYLPVLSGEKLRFAKITKQNKVNKFGIKEPISPTIHPKKINLIITPLVGFDESNNRMGMGGGFYDKTLAFKQAQKTLNTPKLVGLAYNFQKTTIHPNPWDIKLNQIIVI